MGAIKFVNLKEYDLPIQDAIMEMTDGRVDYSIRMLMLCALY